MNYKQAENLRKELLNLIGKSHESLTISDVVVSPLDNAEFNAWTQLYLRERSNDIAILPFRNSDLIVEFVYLHNGLNYNQSGMFMHGNVLVEAKKFGVEIDLDEYDL